MCIRDRQYIEWQDRGTTGSGAPVAIHSADSDIVSQTTRGKDYKDRLPNGNYLDNTANYFVIVLGKTPQPALISMKSTQLKISRKWNSMMSGIKMKGANGMFTPASFSHIYKLKTTQMSNDKGTWFGWEVSKVGPVTATSANKAGIPPLSDAESAGLELNLSHESILAGTCPGGQGSTLVSLHKSPTSPSGFSVRIMREGVIPRADVMRWWTNPT